MSGEGKTVLDLDEMLGQKMQIVVRRKGVEYYFVDMNSLSANKVIQIQTMRQKISRLQFLDDISDMQAKEIETLFDGILSMLCPEFPLNDATYTEKTSMLAFYFTESQPKKVRSPKKDM